MALRPDHATAMRRYIRALLGDPAAADGLFADDSFEAARFRADLVERFDPDCALD